MYVNDLIITGSDLILFQKFTFELHSKFALKNLGFLSSFLGIQVKQNVDVIHLYQ